MQSLPTKLIIGFTGAKGVGKSTAAKYLTKYGFHRMSFASPLKEAVTKIFGWTDECYNPEKKEVVTDWGITPRTALQVIGTDIFRDQLTNYFPTIKLSESSIWIEKMAQQISSTNHTMIVIDDIRYQDEYDMIKRVGGIVIKLEPKPELWMERSSGSMDEKKIDTHQSELGIKKYDYLIPNDPKSDDMFGILAGIAQKHHPLNNIGPPFNLL
jgi:dephospho-CoA kinase